MFQNIDIHEGATTRVVGYGGARQVEAEAASLRRSLDPGQSVTIFVVTFSGLRSQAGIWIRHKEEVMCEAMRVLRGMSEPEGRVIRLSANQVAVLGVVDDASWCAELADEMIARLNDHLLLGAVGAPAIDSHRMAPMPSPEEAPPAG